MSDFFNYTFDIVNSNQEFKKDPEGTITNSKVKIRKPESYFFTDIDSIKTQTLDEAFMPLGTNDTEKSKRFRVTNIFKAIDPKKEINLYAVTKGLLFFAPYGEGTGQDKNKINIFLRPINSETNIGVKIKYFVYRGVLIKSLFEETGIYDDKYVLPKKDSLSFIQRLWREYAEFNKLNIDDTNVKFTAKELGLDPDNTSNKIDKKLFKSYFKADGSYNLPIVDAGETIGLFSNDVGFEIVIDDGDYEQEQSDTGLVLDYNTTKTKQDIDFARAKKCILDVRKYDDFITTNLLDKDYVWGFNNKAVSVKIFRENIYHFIDVAAFYGSHVTSSNKDISGKIYVKKDSKKITYSDKETIYSDILSKFYNQNSVYIYIKSNRNRSYRFYRPTPYLGYFSDITVMSYISLPFNEKSWPFLLRNSLTENEAFEIGYSLNTILSSNFLLDEVKRSVNDVTNLRKNNYILKSPHPFKIKLQRTEAGTNLSQLVYINCFDDIDHYEVKDNLFGPVNLNSIFEKEDFADNVAQRSWVNHLRPTLISEEDNIGLYNTKIVLDGDLISSNQSLTGAADEMLSKNLRTYILLPVEANAENLNGSEVPKDNTPLITAGYAVLPKEGEKETTDNDPVKNYCKDIYGGGEIWGGKINDSGEIKSLVYRRDINEDISIYQLGISQKELNILKDRVYAIDANATNLFFHLEVDTNSTASNFIKYKLKIQFDKADGNLGIPPNVGTSDLENIDYISLYTIDGCFYFTKDYSNNFKFYKEFANIAVDFLPYNLSTYNNGYECGFDYIGFEGRENYKDIIGKYYKNNTNIIQYPKDGETTFRPLILDYFRLLKSNYNFKPSRWRTSFPFHTDSFITLYEGNSTIINCKITKKTNPSKLFYRYNAKYISIDNTAIVPSAKDEMVTKEITPFEDHTITVKALQKFDKDQIIEVTAIEDGKEKSAGKLHILANKYISEIEILLVNCITKIDTTEKNGLPDADKAITELVLKNFLKQIYITPKFVYETLDLSIAPNMNHFKTNHIFTGTEIIKSTSNMFDYCFNLLNYGNKSCSLVLFFFNEKGASVKEDGTVGEGLNGEAYDLGGAKGARIFTGGLKSNAIAHETLHSLGLRHSFDPEGDFTFMKSSDDYVGSNDTDNVMDYFFFDRKRKLIWKWQMEKIYRTNNNGILYTKFES